MSSSRRSSIATRAGPRSLTSATPGRQRLAPSLPRCTRGTPASPAEPARPGPSRPFQFRFPYLQKTDDDRCVSKQKRISLPWLWNTVTAWEEYWLEFLAHVRVPLATCEANGPSSFADKILFLRIDTKHKSKKQITRAVRTA